MTAIAACSRSPAARRRIYTRTGPRLDRQVPGDRRGGAARSSATAPCSTARSSRSTTRAIPASPRSSRRSAKAGAGSACSCSTRSRSTARSSRSCPISSASSGSPPCSARAVPPFILYADHILGKGEQLFDAMCEAGQEGIISKQADAPYRHARTKSWLKVKCTRRQEFVIIGWTRERQEGPRLPGAAARRSTRTASCATPARSAPASRMAVQHELRARLDKLAAAKAAGRRARAPRRAARIG